MRRFAKSAEALLLAALWAGTLAAPTARGSEPPPEVGTASELPDESCELQLPPRRPDVGAAVAAPPGAGAVGRAWRACAAWAKDVPHQVDAVASLRGRFLFVDNVKAGSTSVREMLSKVLNRSWVFTDLPHDPSPASFGCGGRFASTSFAPASLASFFRFSIVRDPVAKFESGVRQAWVMDKTLANLTADEMLERQLQHEQDIHEPGQRCKGRWVNEHLQPNSWKLSARTSDSKLVDYDFIAKMETFDEDWPSIVAAMGNISQEERSSLTAIGRANAHPHDPRSKLSPAGIRRMCQSSVYGREWECFGYPWPAECD